MTTVPEAEEAAAAIEGVRALLWESLEHGIAVAKQHFGEGALVDGSLGPHLARYHARQHLIAHGVVCESIPLNGVAFKWGAYYIRVLKADEGVLPVPGRSKRKQEFYSQVQLALFNVDSGEAPLGPEINLVVLWDVAAGSFNGLDLTLACPKAGGETRASVEAYWYRPLLHPAFDAMPSTPDGEDDLDIGGLADEGAGSDE